MNLYETQYTMLNPMDYEHSQKLLPAISTTSFLPSFTLISQSEHNYLLAYPVIKYEKPERISKKTGAVKQASTRYAVCGNQHLGMGVFGLVYPVLGEWKMKDGNWVLKVGTPYDRKVLKTNVNLAKNEITTSSKIIASYKSEYKLGQNVPYMGYQIAPFFYKQRENTAAFLLMKRQEGVSLKSFMEQNTINSNQRLKICVNLITALQQIHSPQANGSYLVHCDIKPENIMIDENLNVRLIDFGLSGLNEQMPRGRVIGTPIYTDPYLYSSNASLKQDKSHDEGSLARVIAEVWGDNSRHLAADEEEVHFANKNNLLNNLFAGITDLTGAEQQIIRQTITQLAEYDPQDRIPMVNAREDFNNLLVYRTQNATQQLAQLNTWPISQLSKENVLELLKSPHAATLIERFIQQPQEFPRLETLGTALFTLDRPLLQLLQQNNFNFPALILTSSGLIQDKLSADQTQYALELGANLDANTLNTWINRPLPNPDLEWAKLFRVLYKATPDADTSLTISAKYTFATTFYQFFITSPESANNDPLNLELTQQHLKVYSELEHIDNEILDLLEQIGFESPLELAISGALATPSRLMSVVPNGLRVLIQQMDRLLKIGGKVFALETGASPTFRKVKAKMSRNLNNRANLIKMDWMDALNTDSLAAELEHVTEVHRIVQKLVRLFPPQEYQALHQELDALYESEPNSLAQLKTKASHLCLAAQEFNTINIYKLRLCNLDAELLLSHVVIKEYSMLLSSHIKFEPSEHTLELATNAHDLFHELTTLFERLFTLKNSSIPHERKQLMQTLHASTYSALDELTSEGLFELFAHTTDFFKLEQQFSQPLSIQVKASDFIYALMRHNISSNTLTETYKEYVRLFKRINENSLINLSLTNRITKFINLAGSNNKPELTAIHAEFREKVWNYLTQEFTDINSHWSQTNRSLDALIQRATLEIGHSQAQNPNSLFEANSRKRKHSGEKIMLLASNPP